MIKKLDESYLDQIIEIHKDSIFPIWDSLGREYAKEGISEFVNEVFEKGEIYGYFSTDKLVGVIGYEIHKDKDSCEICFLLINSSFQGTGLGRELMEFVENKIRLYIHRIFLEVLIQNPAVNFYKRLDYDVLGKKGNKYVMEKRL